LNIRKKRRPKKKWIECEYTERVEEYGAELQRIEKRRKE